MQMTEGEIKTNILQAKDQRAQIKICAELNAVDEDEIKSILRMQGVDLRELKGTNDGSRASRASRQVRPRKEEARQPLSPSEADESVEQIGRRIRELVTIRDSAEAELKRLGDKLRELLDTMGVK
jgi:hypothetical protein